ncbi:MAG: sugar kinase [Cytophagaceae bacterium]|nr:sugar kinase [Cytophagaceae bacterium]
MSQKILAFGELLLRLSPPGHERLEQAVSLEVQYGGSEANIVASLARFNHAAAFVTRLPENELAQAANNSLRKFGVDTSQIIWGGKRLGIYFLETGAVSRQSKVVYDRADSSIAAIQPGMINWEKVFENITWFHWSGITPALSASAAQVVKEAIEVAAKKNIYISADLNYRANLWNYGKKPVDIMPELIAHCDVVLGGNEDSEKVLGLKVPIGDDDMSVEKEAALIEERCFIWKQAFPKLKVIASTIRRSRSASHNFLAGAVWNGLELFVSRGYEITHIVDRVGGGDAFMGGLIHGILSYKNNFQKALDFATAASALKHTIKGDVNLVSKEEVEKLMQGDKSLRIVR